MLREIFLTWYQIFLGLKSKMSARGSFFIQLFCILVSNSVIAVFWIAILPSDEKLGGYRTRDLLGLSSIVATSMGLSCSIFGNLRYLSQTYANGDIDFLLLYPRSTLLNSLSYRMSIMGWGDLLYGMLLFFGLHLSNLQIIYFVACVLTSSVIITSTIIIFHTIAKLAHGSDLLAHSLIDIQTSVSLFPDTMFPYALRLFLYTLIPAQFISFIPKKIFMDQDIRYFWICFVVAGIYVIFARRIFYLGLKKHQTNGG